MRKLCLVLILALVGAFVLTPGEADARARDHLVGKYHYFGTYQYAKKRYSHRYRHVVRKHAQRHRHVVRKTRVGRSVSLAGVTPVLAAKTRKIVAACGSIVISAVASRSIRSNHPIGRAVDLQGNPRCIYAHLKGWPGGYSTDYAAVRHVHISYNPGGQEWGVRFAHNSGRNRATRYARLASPRYRARAHSFFGFALHRVY